jgi:hypothetical protein
VSKVVASVGSVGHATYGHSAIARWFDPKRHRRAVMFTEDQQHDSGHVNLDHVPLIYTFNLAGYRPSALPAGERGRYTLGGFTDATFSAMAVLEGGRDADWPFRKTERAAPAARSAPPLAGKDHPRWFHRGARRPAKVWYWCWTRPPHLAPPSKTRSRHLGSRLHHRGSPLLPKAPSVADCANYCLGAAAVRRA